jgi:hypothetical protein
MPNPTPESTKNEMDASTKTYFATHVRRREARYAQPNTNAIVETDMSPEDWKVLAEFLGTASGGSIDPNSGSVDGQKSVTVASTEEMTTETKDDSEESALSK